MFAKDWALPGSRDCVTVIDMDDAELDKRRKMAVIESQMRHDRWVKEQVSALDGTSNVRPALWMVATVLVLAGLIVAGYVWFLVPQTVEAFENRWVGQVVPRVHTVTERRVIAAGCSVAGLGLVLAAGLAATAGRRERKIAVLQSPVPGPTP